jgi:hypothetical protein
VKHYHYSDLGVVFFIISGTMGICFYKALSTSLVDITYSGHGFAIKTTSTGIFFIIAGLLF